MRAKTILLALATLSAIAGCGAPPDPPPRSATDPCPTGQAYNWTFARCVYVSAPDGGAVDTTADCHPVTCQVYSDWSRFGDGGAGAGWCSGACDAHCQGDESNELYALEQARLAGMTCSY